MPTNADYYAARRAKQNQYALPKRSFTTSGTPDGYVGPMVGKQDVINAASSPAYTPTPQPTASGGIENVLGLPMDLFPYSRSSSSGGSQQSSQQQSLGSSFQSGSGGSNQSSSSRSGLTQAQATELMNLLMPELKATIPNMPGYIDEATNQAMGAYRTATMNTAREAIPELRNELGKRNIGGTPAADAIMRLISGASQRFEPAAATAAMEAAKMKANIPAMIGSLLGFGQTSEARSSGGSSYQNVGGSDQSSFGTSSGGSSQQSSSEQADPTAMWRSYMSMYGNLVN